MEVSEQRLSLAGTCGRENRERTMKLNTLLAIVISIGCSPISDAATDPSSADYAAAVRLLYPNLQDAVRNESVSPHWIGDQGTFWYQRDGNDGREFVVVTGKGVKAPAFDHEALARAMYRGHGTAGSRQGFAGFLERRDLKRRPQQAHWWARREAGRV